MLPANSLSEAEDHCRGHISRRWICCGCLLPAESSARPTRLASLARLCPLACSVQQARLFVGGSLVCRSLPLSQPSCAPVAPPDPDPRAADTAWQEVRLEALAWPGTRAFGPPARERAVGGPPHLIWGRLRLCRLRTAAWLAARVQHLPARGPLGAPLAQLGTNSWRPQPPAWRGWPAASAGPSYSLRGCGRRLRLRLCCSLRERAFTLLWPGAVKLPGLLPPSLLQEPSGQPALCRLRPRPWLRGPRPKWTR